MVFIFGGAETLKANLVLYDFLGTAKAAPQDWSTLDIGKAENEAWFYSKVTIILRHYLSIGAKHIIEVL